MLLAGRTGSGFAEALLEYVDLELIDGRIKFLKNNWRTRGISSPLFLQIEANLPVNTAGQIIGKMPYFHLFVNEGEVALPPKYVELGENEKKSGDKKSLEGIHSFFVDEWQIGLISVFNCGKKS